MTRDQRSNGIRRLSALAQPVGDAILIDGDDRRLCSGIVVSDDFNEAAVARGSRVGHDHAKKRALLGTCTTQANDDHRRSPETDPRLALKSEVTLRKRRTSRSALHPKVVQVL